MSQGLCPSRDTERCAVVAASGGATARSWGAQCDQCRLRTARSVQMSPHLDGHRANGGTWGRRLPVSHRWRTRPADSTGAGEKRNGGEKAGEGRGAGRGKRGAARRRLDCVARFGPAAGRGAHTCIAAAVERSGPRAQLSTQRCIAALQEPPPSSRPSYPAAASQLRERRPGAVRPRCSEHLPLLPPLVGHRAVPNREHSRGEGDTSRPAVPVPIGIVCNRRSVTPARGQGAARPGPDRPVGAARADRPVPNPGAASRHQKSRSGRAPPRGQWDLNPAGRPASCEPSAVLRHPNGLPERGREQGPVGPERDRADGCCAPIPGRPLRLLPDGTVRSVVGSLRCSWGGRREASCSEIPGHREGRDGPAPGASPGDSGPGAGAGRA